jgi:hypothetical protein
MHRIFQQFIDLRISDLAYTSCQSTLVLTRQISEQLPSPSQSLHPLTHYKVGKSYALCSKCLCARIYMSLLIARDSDSAASRKDVTFSPRKRKSSVSHVLYTRPHLSISFPDYPILLRTRNLNGFVQPLEVPSTDVQNNTLRNNWYSRNPHLSYKANYPLPPDTARLSHTCIPPPVGPHGSECGRRSHRNNYRRSSYTPMTDNKSRQRQPRRGDSIPRWRLPDQLDSIS